MPFNDQALRDMLAKQAITEQIYRYCRGIDRMDRDLALSVWHENGTVDFMGGIADIDYPPGPPPVPVQRHFDWAWNARRMWCAHSHQATTILIDVDGPIAHSETASITVLQRLGEDGMIDQDMFWGRWLDHWSERDGRWAIDHRCAITDAHAPARFAAGPADDPERRLSRRDRDDPSYQFLRR